MAFLFQSKWAQRTRSKCTGARPQPYLQRLGGYLLFADVRPVCSASGSNFKPFPESSNISQQPSATLIDPKEPSPILNNHLPSLRTRCDSLLVPCACLAVAWLSGKTTIWTSCRLPLKGDLCRRLQTDLWFIPSMVHVGTNND